MHVHGLPRPPVQRGHRGAGGPYRAFHVGGVEPAEAVARRVRHRQAAQPARHAERLRGIRPRCLQQGHGLVDVGPAAGVDLLVAHHQQGREREPGALGQLRGPPGDGGPGLPLPLVEVPRIAGHAEAVEQEQGSGAVRVGVGQPLPGQFQGLVQQRGAAGRGVQVPQALREPQRVERPLRVVLRQLRQNAASELDRLDRRPRVARRVPDHPDGLGRQREDAGEVRPHLGWQSRKARQLVAHRDHLGVVGEQVGEVPHLLGVSHMEEDRGVDLAEVGDAPERVGQRLLPAGRRGGPARHQPALGDQRVQVAAGVRGTLVAEQAAEPGLRVHLVIRQFDSPPGVLLPTI